MLTPKHDQNPSEETAMKWISEQSWMVTLKIRSRSYFFCSRDPPNNGRYQHDQNPSIGSGESEVKSIFWTIKVPWWPLKLGQGHQLPFCNGDCHNYGKIPNMTRITTTTQSINHTTDCSKKSLRKWLNQVPDLTHLPHLTKITGSEVTRHYGNWANNTFRFRHLNMLLNIVFRTKNEK